jgi:hypothetical protein
MTTLIAFYSSDGCEGRCDAKCYNAQHPNCDCICGGRNHGKGLQKAIDNTRQLAEAWIETYSQTHKLAFNTRWDVPAREPVQLAMFG